jgi:hypothetical protein
MNCGIDVLTQKLSVQTGLAMSVLEISRIEIGNGREADNVSRYIEGEGSNYYYECVRKPASWNEKAQAQCRLLFCQW